LFPKELPNFSFGYNVHIIYIFIVKACFRKSMFFKYFPFSCLLLLWNYVFQFSLDCQNIAYKLNMCIYIYIYQLFIYYMYTSWACFPLKCFFLVFFLARLWHWFCLFGLLVMMATNMYWPNILMVYAYMYASMWQNTLPTTLRMHIFDVLSDILFFLFFFKLNFWISLL